MTTDVNYIRTSKAPLPVVGTMNQAVVAGNTVFVSGTLGYTPGSLKLVSDNLEEQTIQTFRNVIAILEAAGSSTRNVVQATIFLSDINDLEIVEKIYNQMFGSKTGAKTYLQPSSMYPDVKIQMEAIGITGKMEVEIKYDQ
ncbi:2-iminobutanoate/2-iminopropanoate deaminase-like isoform X1 [Daktulosphaira vitifoliae]|uniref:2-iminobutanoate/2-iminopropanoate deaminase-like isoform X1 n=1 Tax=Daktulosphaira vitifoliae TaxID=58002 RepID=UPI0021AA28D0|nr:2-iminobutanoate/2-iminopropanoate deaminase-like isoform X1 [Daktulosphaira vitifoliae]